MEKNFAKWLREELKKRDWNPSDLAREMALPSPSTVYRILNEERGAGKQICKKIARALKINENIVLYQAGFSSKDPNDPTQHLSPIALRIIALIEDRPESQQKAALSTLEALFEVMGEHEKPALAKGQAAITRQK